MTIWTTILVFASRFTGWLRSASREQDFDTEIETHLALLTDENLRRGMTPQEAARAARVSLGGVTQLKEDQRERRGFPWLGALWQDARYALRVFRRNPGFTLVAVLTIAVGIGVNATMFALLNAVAFKKLPVADAGNLIRLERSFQSGARGDVQYRLFVRRVLLLSLAQPAARVPHRRQLASNPSSSPAAMTLPSRASSCLAITSPCWV